MARPRANFPIVTWPVTLAAPVFVQIQRDTFDETYTIPAGTYTVFDPSAVTPSGTYGLAFSNDSGVDNGSLPARLGSLLELFWNSLTSGTDAALIDVAYDAYTPEQWSPLPVGSGLSPATTGVWAAPAAAAYVIEPESDTGPDDIVIRFSSDPSNFGAADPDVDNVDNDIMGPSAMGAGFWGLFGFGQIGNISGSLRTRSIRLRWSGSLTRYTSLSGVGVPDTTVQSQVPFRGTWCPDQDVVGDDREAIASVGVAANPYSVQSGRVALYGPQRYRVATVFPYVTCNRVDRHRLADESFDRLVEMERGLFASPTYIREMLVTWDDVHRAALDNKPLTLIWQPRRPAPSGLRDRVRGRILDQSSLSSWGSTSSDSTDNGQYRQVVLVMEVENV